MRIKAKLFSDIRLNRIQEALSKRGLKGFFVHTIRRLAASYGKTILGPDVMRITPMGFLCNHSCHICWLRQLDSETYSRGLKDDKEQKMTLDDYKKLFSSMPAGLREVNVVGGGEPLIHEDITGIFRAIKRHGWVGSLITNGTLLTETMIEEMLDMRWDLLRVSTHAGDADTYKVINGVDNYEKLVRNLKMYSDRRRSLGLTKQCKLVVFHVIQRDNLETIDRLFDVAETVGADSIEFDPVIPLNEKDRLNKEEIERAVVLMEKFAHSYSILCNYEEIIGQLRSELTQPANDIHFTPAKSCSVGFDQVHISSSGQVYPCCFSDEVMGNVRKNSFREIWMSKQYVTFRNRLIQGKFAPYCIKVRCTLPGVLHH